MEQTFEGFTPEEANRKADDWLVKQKGIRVISRRQLSAGWGSPPTVEFTQYTVIIEYEPE
jgi:hypothetical protein